MAKKGFDLAALARSQMGKGMAQSVEQVLELPVDKIDANEKNFYEKSALEDLAANIELLGLIHPVAVKIGEDGRWTLIDGERRFQAVKLLGWETIRAVVHRPVSSVFEELMLISANMQQRKMTGAELSKQAERYTECLADLKRSGVEIPGRLRKAAAEAFGVSESRLAKLAAVREHLIPALLDKFDAGEINEAVAYALSRCDAQLQGLIPINETTATWRVAALEENWNELNAPKCPDGGEPSCAAARVERTFAAGFLRCEGQCCMSCSRLRLCGGACEAAKEEAGRLEASFSANLEASRQAATEARAEREREKRERADTQWARFKTLREAAGVSLGELEAIWRRGTAVDADDLRRAEAREEGYIDLDAGVFDDLTAEETMDVADILGTDVYTMLGRERPGGRWDWKHSADEMPEPWAGSLCCWGGRGFRTVSARDYAAAIGAFPGDYDWWCVPVPPAEFKMNMGDAYDDNE